jgi:SNF2 family DNA or RNA helicase
VTDTTLTKAEMKALLDARGGFVRLGDKGWRRLSFQLSPEDEEQFAELGLNARDFDAGKQRLHALQLAGRVKNLMPERVIEAIAARAEEIKTRVTPDLPAGLNASLRPYQTEGFHFLAYLTTNNFGGILADDMGLGKTVQTLAWLLWLRNRPVEPMPEFSSKGKKKTASIHPTMHTPSLVVAPKSVVENWRSEAEKFAPSLKVAILGKGACDAASLEAARKDADIVVMNYVHLRMLEGAASAVPWRAVILDEAQAIKNPDSATAKAAWSLNSPHRIALSGTPIENRLLDLWSIMSFTMPGVLGTRGAFGKTFDQRTDGLARKRLAARTRPFILRRTKGDVAKDLPDRIEEDIICEMDTEQATLYRAELKRARMALLKLESKADLDKARFNILTSLLRLRQICCHPGLVSEKADTAESAKMNALIDVIEPLAAEGHKVLVFSQFVEMLNRIEKELTARLGDSCRLFKLTGQTEDRGDLVKSFQTHEGAATFLVSLRAGGFGLNLTAASYVVLFDPWWNPAVENQAIDRTHRIGQVNKVIAYRLIVKDSIEEKIRSLQKQKSALASDILGEENFARALSLEDFNFLLSE